ncbi:MAG: hypothetical protein IJX91_03620 [Clostridia bacterium]|nr:hypothetical protein [Clostridia bacterium]
MSKAKRDKAAKPSKNASIRRSYRSKQRSTSIYFLLWAVFAAFSLLIVLLFGFMERVLITQTYKQEAAIELNEKGDRIERMIGNAFENGLPPEYRGSLSTYIRTLSSANGVDIFILSAEGEVIAPQVPTIGGDDEMAGLFDFGDRIRVLLAALEEKQSSTVIYEGEGEYVYGAEMRVYGQDMYLYVSKSLDLMVAASEQMGSRMVVVAIFIFILAFAVSSAVSGWLARPITEMTKKAELLARGDFAVDFHGNDYGQEMVALADTLNYARDELSKTDRMQKELIANVSHDFKTPLTMIKAYASMIVEISGDVPEKRNKHAQVIIDEADRLASLVGDMLELSKMQSGIAELKNETFDMSAYLHEIIGRFDYLKETQGYTFEVDVEDGLYTAGDELKLGQVLYNLIGNAVNYTGEDKQVRISLKRTGERIFRFAVTDTGAGIKPEELPTIWDRYYRSSDAHKRPVKGTGLGLSIVKTVLERHCFVFGVNSEVGKGSTFYVDFPLSEEQTNGDQ